MSSRTIALVIGLVVFAGGFFLFGPRHCIGRNDGTVDPSEIWDECTTYAGLTITLPHTDASAPTTPVSVDPGKPHRFEPGSSAEPHWVAVILPLGFVSLVAVASSHLVLEWRRRGLDDLLVPSQNK